LTGAAATAAVATSQGHAGESEMPEPIRDNKGATDIGPRNSVRDSQNPDLLTPPSTDKGLVPNLRFSLADAHMELKDGGWSREVTQRELPAATEMAGVNMRLKTGVKRILRLGRLRLRGPSGARDEFLLAATAQNLRKLAKLRAMPAACPVPA
jgi:oxalate decarboxylase